MKETTYINNGEIYKSADTTMDASDDSFMHSSKGNIISKYYRTPASSPKGSLDFLSIKENTTTGERTVKRYYKSKEWCDQDGTKDWYDNSALDVCPCLVGKIISTGVEKDVVELYFDIADVSHMKEIATYYNLPTPLKEDEAFNSAEHNWNLTFLTDNPILVNIRMGSIKFIDGVPTYFKYYKYVPR